MIQKFPPLRTGIYLALAISGIAAAYVLNEWAMHWWGGARPPKDGSDRGKTAESAQPSGDPAMSQTRTLPPLRVHALPPPSPNGRALLASSSLAVNPDAMASSASLHTLSSEEGTEDGPSRSNMSDTDSEPFVDVLSPPPPPTHVISRRRSVRNHDLFASSHISFSDLGNLVAPQSESE